MRRPTDWIATAFATLIAVFALGFPAYADEGPLRILRTDLAMGTLGPEVNVTAKNDGDRPISYAVITCALLNGDAVLEISNALASNISPMQIIYARTAFSSKEHSSSVTCRVESVKLD